MSEAWVIVSLFGALLVLVGLLFCLMFKDRRYQMEQMLSAWNQTLNTQIRVIDDLTKELTKERELLAGERGVMTQMLSHMEQWLTYVVETRTKEQRAKVDGGSE